MKLKRNLVLLPSVLLLALTACSDNKKEASAGNAATQPEAAVKKPLPDKLSIFYGNTRPTLFSVPQAYQWSIGALLDNGDNFCTGTLIEDDVVLTAAHCAYDDNNNISSINGISFGIGPDMKNPAHKIAVKKIIPHEEYLKNCAKDPDGISSKNDVALFILKEKASKYVPTLKPIPMNKASLASLKGDSVQNVGYGTTEGTGSFDYYNYYNTKRLWTVEEVTAVSSFDFTVDGKGISSVCMGDSGGPALYAIDNQIYIVGTVSWGQSTCLGEAHYARVNDNIAWITEKLGHEVEDYLLPIDSPEEPVPADECEGITADGVCDGTIHKWCSEDGTLHELDCKSLDMVCGNIGEFRTCITPEVSSCGNIGRKAICDGNILKWCGDDGTIKEVDCTILGEICASNEYAACVKEEDSCGSITTAVCDGNVVKWCGAIGTLIEHDCAEENKTCGLTSFGEYWCIDAPADNCGDVTFVGGCDGQVARWCQNGIVYEHDCALENKACGFVNDVDGYWCVETDNQPDPNDPCGGISYLGRCNGNVAEWCEEGTIIKRDCARTGYVCGYVSPELGYYCK